MRKSKDITLEEFDYLTGGLDWNLEQVRKFLRRSDEEEA